MLRDRLLLPKPLLGFFRAVVSGLLFPRTLSFKLKEATEDWSEMAPYRIRSTATNFDGMSATGLGSLKSGLVDQKRCPDEFTRRAMMVWSFVDSDRRTFGKNSLITARQWMRLASLYWEYGQAGDARIFYQRGLKIFRLQCETTDDRLIAAQKALADFYRTLGLPAEAEVLLKEVAQAITAKLKAAETDRSTPSANKKNSVSDLGCQQVSNLLVLSETLKIQKKYLEAAEVLNNVVDVYEAPGLPTGDECIGVYRELSFTYSELGDRKKADLFLATSQKLNFMLIMAKCVGDSSVLIVELEQLAQLYRQRNKSHIVDALETRIGICRLLAKVSGANYPGIEEDLERLALLYDVRDDPGDAVASFHLRARAKRIIEAATTQHRVATRIR